MCESVCTRAAREDGADSRFGEPVFSEKGIEDGNVVVFGKWYREIEFLGRAEESFPVRVEKERLAVYRAHHVENTVAAEEADVIRADGDAVKWRNLLFGVAVCFWHRGDR